MKRYGNPIEVVTNGHRSYRAVMKAIGNETHHSTGRWLSTRSATIRAVEFTQALSFDAAIIDHELNRNELSFCYVIFRLISEVLAERLRNTTNVASDYHKVLARFGNP